MTETQDSDDILIGRPGRVVHVSADGLIFVAQLEGGASARVSTSQPVALKSGDTVLVNEQRWQLVPAETWHGQGAVAIVRQVRKNRVLLDTGIGIQVLRRPARWPSALSEGNTVEFDPQFGIIKVLAKKPIRPRDPATEVQGTPVVPSTSDPALSLASFGGYPDVVARAEEFIETQLQRRAEFDAIGARPVRGLILTGPPGTGKTYLAKVIASVADAAFYPVSGPEIVSQWLGNSEAKLRAIFEEASKQKQAIIFFDEIDSIASRRSADLSGNTQRLVGQLLTLMDGFMAASNTVVLAATNRVEDLDPALLRPGRFDWHIDFKLPSRLDRLNILQVTSKDIQTGDLLPLQQIADLTEGWSGAMLAALWTDGALLAVRDGRTRVAEEDLTRALERVGRATLTKGATSGLA